MESYYTSGQVAKELRVSISTLKRWVSLPDLELEEQRNLNGWRLFSEMDLDALKKYKKNLRRTGKRFKKLTLLPMKSSAVLQTLQKGNGVASAVI